MNDTYNNDGDDYLAPSRQFLESSRFWIQKVFVPIMVTIGIGGNIITVMILTRRRMRCSTNIYLTALAVADIAYLLFVFTLSFSHYQNINDRKYELYWRFFGLAHWLCDAASSTSVWLTVSFTVERYIAVCHPIRGKVLCTENRAKTIVIIIAIFCILTTASTTFEYQLSIDEHCLRNCTNEELFHRQHQQIKSNITSTRHRHYLASDSDSIVVANLDGSESFAGTKQQRHHLDTPSIVREIYTNLEPRLRKVLPVNCTKHSHIVYVPFFQRLQSDNGRNAITNNNTILVYDRNDIQDLGNGSTVSSLDDNTLDVSGTNDTVVALHDVCCTKKLTVRTEYTSLGNNTIYKAIMYWYSSIFFGLLPLVLIATFNCFLIYAVYESQRGRKRMTNNSQDHSSLSNENRITVMLIGVVILFLICQTPTASFLIYDNFQESKDEGRNNIEKALGNIFNFLLTVNAACNFLLYCVLSRKYRTTFRSFFCARRNNRQDTLAMTLTTGGGSVSSKTHSKNNNIINTGLKRNVSAYQTPRNLETQSLTSIPRSKSLITRPPGKAKSIDLNI